MGRSESLCKCSQIKQRYMLFLSISCHCSFSIFIRKTVCFTLCILHNFISPVAHFHSLNLTTQYEKKFNLLTLYRYNRSYLAEISAAWQRQHCAAVPQRATPALLLPAGARFLVGCPPHRWSWVVPSWLRDEQSGGTRNPW
jgi:hypothetical protein